MQRIEQTKARNAALTYVRSLLTPEGFLRFEKTVAEFEEKAASTAAESAKDRAFYKLFREVVSDAQEGVLRY